MSRFSGSYRWPEMVFVLVLSITVVLLYRSHLDHEFVFDDEVYILTNPYVQKGVSPEGFVWAFTGSAESSWHPVTWLSLMVDFELYEFKPYGYNLTNLIIHLLNSVLLFLILRRMSGVFWPGALAAALFALHPINVESVIWASQRKNTLSAFFWMLSMWTYVWYVEKPRVSKYLLIAISFALGLMCKLTIIAFPLAMVLLDYWPLGRLRFGREKEASLQNVDGIYLGLRGLGRLVLEKVPLLVMAVGVTFVLVYFDFNRSLGKATWPMGHRLANALVSYVKYLRKLLWPSDLAVWYPYPNEIPLWESLGALLFLSAVTVLLFRAIQKRPYLMVGWLWFLGVLFPAGGLVQSKVWPAMADRHVYLAAIGVFVMISWGLWEAAAVRVRRELVFIPVSILALVPLTLAAERQLSHWKTPVTLFEHALDVSPDNNWLAHGNLSSSLFDLDRTDEVLKHIQELMKIKPDWDNGPFHIARSLYKGGRIEEALPYFQEAARRMPESFNANFGYGGALMKSGRTREAIPYLKTALGAEPESAEVLSNLGVALVRVGRPEDAIPYYQKALRIKPDLFGVYYNLGLALARVGKTREAKVSFQRALELKPDFTQARQAAQALSGQE